MSLLYLVKQQHAVRGLADSIGKQAAVFVAHISCRRTYQLRHSMLFGIFAHVETNKGNPQFLRQDTRHLGLPDACRPDKEQRCQRFVVVEQPSLGHLDGFNNLAHSFVLPVYFGGNALAERFELFVVLVFQSHCIYLAHLLKHIVNLLAAHNDE